MQEKSKSWWEIITIELGKISVKGEGFYYLKNKQNKTKLKSQWYNQEKKSEQSGKAEKCAIPGEKKI